MRKGKLYLIPNFIGEPNTDRAFPGYNIEVIKNLKNFWVENPKPARAFLKAINPEIIWEDITLFAYDKHDPQLSEEADRQLIQLMKNGEDVGILSDAGCPGIADPGGKLVALAHKNGLEVCPLVGPSSILLSLMASGLNGQQFTFAGYLPRETEKRVSRIQQLSKESLATNTTFLFIETPYRVDGLFKDLLKNLHQELYLGLGLDFMTEHQQVITKKVIDWKNEKSRQAWGKRQVVFVIGRP